MLYTRASVYIIPIIIQDDWNWCIILEIFKTVCHDISDKLVIEVLINHNRTGNREKDFVNAPLLYKFLLGANDMFRYYIIINDWVNNREAGDLRRYCVHYDVIVMRLDGIYVCPVDVIKSIQNLKSTSAVR